MVKVTPPLFRLQLEDCRWLESGKAFLKLTVAGYTTPVPGDRDLDLVPTALALLRTIFADHSADEEHASNRFFGNRLAGTPRTPCNFSVTRQGDAVLLSDFTFPALGRLASVSVPLPQYAEEIVAFARQVYALPPPARPVPWTVAWHREQSTNLKALLAIAADFVTGRLPSYTAAVAKFRQCDGRLGRKRRQ